MRDAWSGNQFGDIWLGAKINLASQFDQKPVAFGIRGMLKLPTADDEDPGVGTGKMDFAFDAIVSKEINERVELSGFGGMIFRGSPDDISISNGFRYGFGLGLPSRKGLRLTAELHGETYFDDSVEVNRTLTGIDGSVAPAVTDLDSPFNASVGLTWQGSEGRVRRRRDELAHGDGRALGVRAATKTRPATRSASSCGSATTPACASTCRRHRRHPRRHHRRRRRTGRRP